MAPISSRASFRWLLALTALAALGVGCSKSKDADPSTDTSKTAKITGKVTYSRIPLLTNDKGEPTGLETDATKFTTLPARSVQVRLWVAENETSTTGQVNRPWRLQGSVPTTSEGIYTFEYAHKGDTDAFVELVSTNAPSSGAMIRLVADPAGIDSNLPQSDRPLYILRKGVAGKLPEVAAVPGEKITGDATVNFDIGQTTAWWLNSDIASEAVLQQAVKEPSPTGSRVLGILDSFSEFSAVFGNASTPNVLDLHYRPGVSHARGSFIEYDLTRYPKAYSPLGYHYFGSLRGGASNDDAWDAGVIATLAAQNNVFGNTHSGPWAFVQPMDRWSLDAGKEMVNLHPSVALQQANIQVLAAIALKSPYLADTLAGAAPRVVDVRKVGDAPRNIFSTPNLRALAWEIALKAHSLPSPGVPADWAKLTGSSAARYFIQVVPRDANTKQTDVISVFSQLARLKEDKGTTETVDLKAIFTDEAIKTLVQPFGIEWPRPTTGALASFLSDWGTDFAPETGKPLFAKALTLGMAEALLDGSGLYPNASKGETATVLYATSKDQAYFLDVQPLPPAGVKLEIRISNPATLGGATTLLKIDANTPSDPAHPIKRVVFLNTTKDGVASFLPISFHLVSPTAKVASYPFTVTLRPTL